MICQLCKKEIKGYNKELNHFMIDEGHSADLCQSCIDKLIKWQQSIYAKLFPTKTSKKRVEK